MRNLYSKTEFLNIKNDINPINEGLFNFIGKLFSNISTYIKKVKGGQEIQDIYNKYLKKINDDIKKKVQVDLNLTAEVQINSTTKTTTPTTTIEPVASSTTNDTKPADTEVKKESNTVRVHLKNKINEADVATAVDKATNAVNTVKNTVNQAKEAISPGTEAKEAGTNVKMSISALKGKANLIQQIIDADAEVAKNEMNRVLAKYGGAEKNPKLTTIIANKVDEFKLAFLNAKIKIYDAGGDKTSSLAVAKNRDVLSKQLDEKWKNLSKETPADASSEQSTDFKIGDTVKYHSDSLNKNVEEKIIKVEGDKLTFNGANGEFTKNKSEVTKNNTTETPVEKPVEKPSEKPVEKPVEKPSEPIVFKEGDRISWTPEGQDKEIIRTITKVEGDKLTFKEGDKTEGKDMTKKSSDVKKIEAKTAASQVQPAK